MSKQGWIAGILAVAAVTAILGAILFSHRNSKVELTGEVLKVRSNQVDAEHTVVLMDVRLRNPSAQQFMVKNVEVYIDESDGKSTQADVFSDVDGQRILDYYPVLGKKFNPSLIGRDRIQSGKSADRTLMVSAPMPDDQLGKRRRFRIVIRDADGAVTEVAETR